MLIDEMQVNQVSQLLRLEANAIMAAANRLQRSDVEQALQLLVECSGKVVTIGAGKSGIVAHKIAATLTSIGTVAVSLHPADALHGDMGIVVAGDVALVLSNSGETDEVLSILPHLKHRNIPIIALTGNLSSTLARHADVVLDASVDKEACPWNLAPTASTTLAMAIGDALAMTVMQIRQRTIEDFALNHPAGRLGKRITLHVRDLMHSGSANPLVLFTSPWIEVLGAISKGGLGAVSVVDERGSLLGIVTDGDLRRTLQSNKLAELEHLPVSTFMTANPVVATPQMLAYDALQLMENRPSQISVLPVVDQQNYCIGLVRVHDIIRSGI